jgi:antitoxin component YwqK of YwqJK toxin-antitoxin module
LKKLLLFVCVFFRLIDCFSQETIEKKNKLNDNIIEKFQVLKDHQDIRNGAYQALYRRRVPVAQGNYTNNKKTGAWRFYDPKGKLMQVYDYDTRTIKYEAKEYAQATDLSYGIDKEISDTDKITKPLKVGGRYYGYLPYLGLYQPPFNPYQYSTYGCIAMVELVISPLGRLADFKVHTNCSLIQYDQTITMHVNLFKEEDKQFVPATYNGEPVVSRIFIRCILNSNGELEFMSY